MEHRNQRYEINEFISEGIHFANSSQVSGFTAGGGFGENGNTLHSSNGNNWSGDRHTSKKVIKHG